MSEAIVGSVAVEVVPSANNFAQKLREKLLPDADRVGGEAGRVLSDRIQAAIGDVKIRVDTTAAKSDLDLLREDLRRLGGEDARIKVEVATGEARAELDRLREDLARFGASSTTHTVKIRKDSTGGGDSSGGDGGGGFGLLTAGIALGPALIPVLGAAIPLIAGIGAAMVGAAAGGAVLKMAFSGIGDAVTALSAKNNQSGQQLKAQAAQQLASANSILNAQDAVAASVRALRNAQAAAGQQAVQSAESVQNAEQGLTDARRSAAMSVANAQQSLIGAEQSYTASLYTEHQAQIALDLARKQAAQTLQDLSNQVKDGALSQRQATLDLQNAMQNLKVVDFNPHSTQQQRDEAQLQVDQAKQHLSELELANSRLVAQKQIADKQGVSGAPAVVAAEHAAAQATQARQNALQGVGRAQAAVAEAQRAGAESVAKAEQGVTDALRQQAIQAASSQQAIISAEQGVVSSQRSLAQAYASAGAQGSAANAAVASAMAQLTPAGQQFALFVANTVKPALKSITNSAQGGFLPGFQDALKTLMPYIPGFAKFVGDIARELGNMAQAAAKGLASPFWKQFGTFLGDMAKSSLPVLGQIIGNLATGFAGLFQALAPAGAGMGGGLVHITKAFADWATHLGTNKGFQGFLQFVKDNAPVVGQFFRDLAVIAGHLFVAFAPMGAVLAGLLGKLASFVATLSPGQTSAMLAGFGGVVLAFKAFKAINAADEISKVGKALATAFKGNLVILAITLIVGGLIYAYTHFKTFREVVNTVAKAIAEAMSWLWEHALKPIFKGIGDNWHFVATAFKLYWDDYLHPTLRIFGDVISFLWSDVLKPTFQWIGDHWHLVTTAMKYDWDYLLHPVLHVMAAVFGNVGSAFSSFRDGLSTVWADIKKIFGDGANFITQHVLNPLIDAINKVTGIFGVKPIPDIPKIDTSVATGASSTGQAHQGAGGRVARTFAHGGVLGGYAPGVDSIHAMLSPGEGVLVPEAVRGLGAGFVLAANKHFSNRPASSDGHHFAGGGIGGVIGSVVSAVNPVAGVIGGLFGGSATSAALDLAEAPIKALLAHLAPPIIKKLGQGAFGYIDNAVRAFMGAGGHSAASSNAGSAGGAAQWAPIVNQVLAMLGIPSTALAGVLSLINHESGGNPNAINLTDSNAMAGHPSQGLMQTIPGTFAAYAGQFASRGINDPLANIYAGVNYALHRYGVGMLASGGNHDSAGNYIGYDNGGYLQPGITQVYNGTGKPERVFTDEQWAKLSNANGSQQKGGSVPAVFHITDSPNPYATAQAVLRLQQFVGNV